MNQPTDGIDRFDDKEVKDLLWSMIAKCPQNSSGMKTSCCIGSLVCQVEISNLSCKIIKEKHIAGSDIAMNNSWLNFFISSKGKTGISIGKTFCGVPFLVPPLGSALSLATIPKK
uniref:Uncharacterized protein n=1 Tax=Solanum lycopersicum TaxID=4081 RepID=A0A3Q7IL40_SOLLC